MASSPKFRAAYDSQEGNTLSHPNGQTDYYYIDSFVDPWLPRAKKPVLLIQHGYARTAEFWYHWVPLFARKYIVIRRDIRGHGNSSSPKRISPWSEKGVYDNGYQYTIETIVMEIVDFLDQLQIEKVHFLGESTSGQLGEALAALHPERMHSLITISTPTHLPSDKRDFLGMGYPSWPESVIALGSRGWGEALSAKAGTAPVHKNPEYGNWWIDEMAKSSPEGLAGYAEFLSQLNTREYLEKIQCPTLILAPTHSAATPTSESEYAAAHIPNARLMPIDSRGHEIYIENPEQCIKEIDLFLESLGL